MSCCLKTVLSGCLRFRYRNIGECGSAEQEKWTDIGFICLWFWVSYHMITKYDHIIVSNWYHLLVLLEKIKVCALQGCFTPFFSSQGEYDWPDASSWTDEELGVPPDDYEPPMRA